LVYRGRPEDSPRNSKGQVVVSGPRARPRNRQQLSSVCQRAVKFSGSETLEISFGWPQDYMERVHALVETGALQDPENPTFNLGILVLVRSKFTMQERFEASIRVRTSHPFGNGKCILLVGPTELLKKRHRVLKQSTRLNLPMRSNKIDVTAADVRTAKLLAVPVGNPLLRISQLFYTTKGRAVIYGRGLYLHGRHVLAIRRFR